MVEGVYVAIGFMLDSLALHLTARKHQIQQDVRGRACCNKGLGFAIERALHEANDDRKILFRENFCQLKLIYFPPKGCNLRTKEKI